MSDNSSSLEANASRNGLASALLAYLMWGLLPIYFKLVSSVAPAEVLAHRVFWAVPFGALIILARRQWPAVWQAITCKRTLCLLLLSAALIAVNWFIYIVAVQQDQVFQASLGYYINPLLNVVVGVLFLGERLRRFQVFAVLIAAVGVAVLTLSGAQFPWIAAVLAVSFSAYGVIRKQLDVGGMPGLFVETLILAPVTVIYLLWLINAGTMALGQSDRVLDAYLVAAGPLTVLPLLFFALAARRLPLSILGIMQFLAPTLQFLVGVAYGETLTLAHQICFACIWTAIALFIADAWYWNRKTAGLRASGV